MSEAPTPNSATPAPASATPAPADGGHAPAAAPAAPSLAETLFPEGDSPVADPSAAADTPPADEPKSPDGAEGADSESGTAAAIDPASYNFTFPEGFTPADDLVTEAREVLSAAGVPADKAQSVIDLYVKTQTAAQSAATAAFEAQQREWLTEINSIPEFQGTTRETSLQAIGRVLDEYGPELKAEGGLFANPAIGNNPALARFMLNVANALSEGTPAPASRPAPNGRDGQSLRGRTLGQVLFPEQPQQ